MEQNHFRHLTPRGRKEQTMCQSQLSLFGVPVVKHGQTTLTFSTRKAQALLIYLAVEGGLHTRKSLSESFWPELDAEHGRAALRATLFELRNLLERSHGPGEQAHLLVERDTLGLNQDSSLLLDLRLVEAVSKRVGRQGALLAGEGMGNCRHSSSKPRAWCAAHSWQDSHCATRNFSTIGRVSTASTGTCACTSSLMLCRGSTNEQETWNGPSIP